MGIYDVNMRQLLIIGVVCILAIFAYRVLTDPIVTFSMGKWSTIKTEKTMSDLPSSRPRFSEHGVDARNSGVLFVRSLTSRISQVTQGNLISNGDFEIPLSNPLSNWGHGRYTDQITARYPGKKVVWINFLLADVDITIEQTEIGNALKIMHESKRQPHRIGLMEKNIKSTRETDALSFWAKAPHGLPEAALIFSTNDNWEGPGVYHFPEANKSSEIGPKWKYYTKELSIEQPGVLTFYLVSQGRGVVYITDISLVKVAE